MKPILFIMLLLFAPWLMGAERTLGPITSQLADDVYVEASEDMLLGFVGGTPANFQAHFNISKAESAEIRSGNIDAPDDFSDLDRLLKKKKKASAVSPGGHQIKRIEGRMLVEGKDAFAYAVVFAGKRYSVYFALVDRRGQEEARKFFDEIFVQIDRSKIRDPENEKKLNHTLQRTAEWRPSLMVVFFPAAAKLGGVKCCYAQPARDLPRRLLKTTEEPSCLLKPYTL